MTIMPLTSSLLSLLTFSAPLRTVFSSLGRTITPFAALFHYSKWALEVSLDRALFGHRDDAVGTVAVPARHVELGVSWHHGEAAECAVCLCKVEAGDEIRELRCNHLFHRVCLDRWLGFKVTVSCPLCRGSAAPPRAVTGLGADVLFFKLWEFGPDDRDGTWWLR